MADVFPHTFYLVVVFFTGDTVDPGSSQTPDEITYSLLFPDLQNRVVPTVKNHILEDQTSFIPKV